MRRKKFTRNRAKWYQEGIKLFEENMERLEAFAEANGRMPHKHEAPRLYSWMDQLREMRRRLSGTDIAS